MNRKVLLSLFAFAPLAISSPVLAESAPAVLQPSMLTTTPLLLMPEKISSRDASAAPLYLQANTLSDEWQLSLAIPIWIPSIKGDFVVRGRELSPDQSTGDSIEILETRVNGAAALHLEAEKSGFGLFLDLLYVDLLSENNKTETDTEASLKGFIGEVGTFYTIVAPKPDVKGWGRFRLDALGGLRITDLKIGLEGNTFDLSANRTLYDPFVGARMELGLTEWLSLRARGDFGGFGISAWDTSDFSYNVEAGLEFHLAEWFDLGLGYRWLIYDFDSETRDASADFTLSGPFVALQFNF